MDRCRVEVRQRGWAPRVGANLAILLGVVLWKSLGCKNCKQIGCVRMGWARTECAEKMTAHMKGQDKKGALSASYPKVRAPTGDSIASAM